MSLILFVQSRLEFLRCNVAAGLELDSDRFASLSGEACSAISKKMTQINVPAAMATKILTDITKSDMRDDHKVLLRNALNASFLHDTAEKVEVMGANAK